MAVPFCPNCGCRLTYREFLRYCSTASAGEPLPAHPCTGCGADLFPVPRSWVGRWLPIAAVGMVVVGFSVAFRLVAEPSYILDAVAVIGSALAGLLAVNYIQYRTVEWRAADPTRDG